MGVPDQRSSSSGVNMKSLAVQVLTGRWLMVFASFLLMVTAGASYMFGLYSNDIKSVLGYDQTTLNLISFSKDLGANIGILSGLINEVTPPWVVLSIGAVLNFFGNFMIWLAVARKIPPPKVWHMCLYIAIGANSHTFTNTGALVTCVKNFPESRGVVLGLLKGYTGISAAVIAQLYRAFYGDDTSFFTLFVAWLPTALSFAFLRTIRIIKTTTRSQNDVKVFYRFLYISLCLAGFLLVIIILEKTLIFNKTEYGLSAAAVLFLLFLPIVVVFKEEHKFIKSKSASPLNNPTVESPRPSPPPKQAVSWWKDAFKPPEIGEDYTILQALFSIDMLTLLLATICGLGGSMTMMDNLGQIGTSFGYPLKKIANFVALTSIWIYLGQITVGILSEIFIAKYKCPRPLFLTIILLLSSVGHLLIAFNVPNGLYVATVVTGFSFGAFWPLIFTLISELFGLKYYSTLYNFGGLTSPIGLYLLNVKVTGYYYDKEARKQMAALGLVRKPGEALNCLGGECFRLSFIIITVVTLFGALISLVLVVRTREFYKGDIYKKFRVKEETSSVDNVGVGQAEMTKGMAENEEKL
ncbi:Major facilitator [Trema orientale]|uniref:Major facilitator n=1 Tax=Trema orientale TaxID=63057 RepID=A0A2P5FLL0_TREOI|nr:Major facilitator [Trema orientale]